MLDRLAARQIDEPMLRFGGEDAAAQVDPAVTGYTLGSDPIAAADLGLRNVDRLMDVLVPATSRLGHDYSHMASLYEDLVAHRHRQLAAVARLVGGVRETRYQAGRGGPPFVPVEPQQARAAVKFLCARAFASPGRLLDPEVLLRAAPEGWADAVQGSNLKLLTQLIDPGVFQRLSEAQALRTPTGAYLGVDLLADLNDGLFSELADADIAIGLYRREIQRSYVTLLVALAREKEEPGKPMRRPYRSPDQPPDRLPAGHGPALMQDGAPPDLAAAGRASRLAPGHPSEFRAALLDAAQTLSRRIKGAQPKVHDRATAAHLADLLKALGEIV